MDWSRLRTLLLALVWFSLVAARLEAADSPALDSEWERTVKAAEQEGQVNVYKIASDAEWQAFQKNIPRSKSI